MTEPVDLAEMARDLCQYLSGTCLMAEKDKRLPCTAKNCATTAALESAHLAGQRLMQERAAVECDNYARDGRYHKEYACEVADEIAARTRALVPELPG